MVQMEAQQLARNSIEPPLECSDFDSELEILYGRMAGQVAAVLRPFLAFSRKYNEGQAQNMLALMLDPRFKGLELLQDYVGREVAKKVVDEYDTKVLVPMLVKVAQILSPTVVAQPTAPIIPHVSQTSLFGAPASTAEASKGYYLASSASSGVLLLNQLMLLVRYCGGRNMNRVSQLLLLLLDNF